MANDIKTNKLTSLVALRFAENANYLTLGAAAHFSDQLAGKRNGSSYDFVLRDGGLSYDGTTLPNSGSREIKERVVNMTLDNKGVVVETGSIEEVTDLNWDKEVAEPNGKKLANKWVKAAIDSDVPKCVTAFVGSGFTPLAKAGAHLSSQSAEEVFGFVDPQMQAILASNGQQFMPVGAPSTLYANGFLGTFQGVKYTAQRFLKQVVVPSLGSVTLSTASSSAYSVASGAATIKIAASAASTAVIAAGTPLFIDGIYAAGIDGEETAVPAAFIVKEAVTLNGTTAVTVKIEAKDYATGDTREICKIDGGDIAATDFNNKAVTIPEAGVYFGGILHLNGAKECEELPSIATSNGQTTKGKQAGISCFETRFFDGENMKNVTRWDAPILRGVADTRGFAYVLIK